MIQRARCAEICSPGRLVERTTATLQPFHRSTPFNFRSHASCKARENEPPFSSFREARPLISTRTYPRLCAPLKPTKQTHAPRARDHGGLLAFVLAAASSSVPLLPARAAAAVMTFPLVCYCDAVPRPIAALFKVLHAVALVFVLLLCFLGLYEFPYTPEDHAPLINGPQRPPRGDGPPPEAVKQRLPPVEFLELSLTERSPSRKRSLAVAEDEASGEPTCRVCLETLEATDEVRRLGNCTHAFHTGCIDRWIDLGEVTCPLCRSHLLPRRRAGLLGRARLGS
ncbi:E3 ubiquitin-protein ligase EL5-like [Phragmites australis]|uniref:E3 ubiquitin-protein ligase EL5-like n=1 Tax=Phragmites australis TaxID=29695 RepID=UPI002D799F8D|nr:E3 ubiquitin-protein ligase EL5-like [Phragmites australis]